MEAGPKTIRLARLVWPLALGLGLAVGLLLAFAAHPAVEAQAVTPGFTVDLFHDRVWGRVGPGELVTITGPGGVYGAARANATGFFWTPLWDGATGTEGAINDGDVITFYVNGWLAASITARDVTGHVDVLNDRVVGHIPGISTPTAVTVTVKEGPQGEPLPGAPQATTTTDSSGNFTATFSSVDIAPHYWATVDYAAGGAVRDHLAPAGVFLVASTWGGIYGSAQPGQLVTVTVGGGPPLTTTTDPLYGVYWIAAAPAPGDLVEVDLGGSTVVSTVVAALTAMVDPATDLVTGIAPAGADVRVILWRWTDDEYRYYEVVTTASVSSVYTANMGSVVDLWPSDWLNVATADGEGDETLTGVGAPFIQVWDSSSKNRVDGRADGPGLPVTVTLDTGTDIYTVTYTSAADASFSAGLPDDIQAGHVVTIQSPTWSDSMTVADITLGFDVDNDQVTGESPAGHAEVEVGQWEGWAYPINGSAMQAGTLTSPFTVTLDGFDLRFGHWINYTHFNNDGHQTIAHRNLPHIQVEMPHGVGGRGVVPDEGVVATLYYSDGITVKAWTADDRDSDPIRFWFEDWGGEQIVPGDWVTVTGASGWEAGAQVVDLTVAVDEATDHMWGQAPVGLLHAHWDNYPGPDGREEFMPTDGAGNYLIDWSAYGVDVRRGHCLRPYYSALSGNQVARTFRWPQMRVNYGHDWVGGDYEAGRTFWITVTDSIGAVKATAVMTATPGGGWGGDGFETEWDDWSPEQPDIEPGDWAYFQADDGYSTAIHVGTITGELDVDGDTVSGTINANWFTQTLNVRCEVWAEDGPEGIDTTADPDGGTYFCDFGNVGWDLLPGQSVAVHYLGPDGGDRVINVFREPVVYLRIGKGAEGNPTEGGNFAFTVQYWNDGDGDAEDTVITDTMLGGMAYITDTSSFTHTGSGTPGDPIVWHLGTLPSNSSGRFDVFVQVTAAQSGMITNTVEIATSSPYDQGDPGEKVSTRSAHVEANDTHLNVGKGAWTGDPAAGTDFVFNVNVCNNGSTSSSQLNLTDTLHPSMTLQTWWGQYPGWTEVASSSHLLVVSRPSIPGWWCGEVYLRVHLDAAAWPGMYITNAAAISASNDMEGDDNEAFWEGQVREPHTNLYASKQLEWGRIVPGGEMAYEIRYGNNGNVPVDNVLITDTLPISATFSRSWRWTEYGEPPVTPTVVTADYVVWDVGTLDNGYDSNIGVALDIDNDASPGAVLTNAVEISPRPEEDRYDDNGSAWVETLNDLGPNLRLSKYHRWEGDSRIFYGIFVKNLGSTGMEDIWITDTYPISTTSDGDFWVGHGPWFTYTHDAPNRQFIIWAEALGPGDTGHVGFWVDLDGPIHGVQGLIFANTVEAPWPGDVDPDDNSDVELAYSGPDLYAEKWISDGEPRPGARITFTVRCGNSSLSPWEVSDEATTHLVEHLPDGMSYITSVWPDGNPHPPFLHYPDTGLTTWDMGRLSSDDHRWFYLVVDLDADLEGGDVLLNQLEFYESPVVDVDPNPDNNTFELPVTIIVDEHEIYLPLILR